MRCAIAGYPIRPEKEDEHVECFTYIMCYSVYNNIHEMCNSWISNQT